MRALFVALLFVSTTAFAQSPLVVDADWSADCISSNCYPDDGAEWTGNDGGTPYRTVIEFDITSLSASDTVTQVDFEYEVTAEESGTYWIGAYDGDGQGDPSAASNADNFTRCDISSDNYASGAYMDGPEESKTISDLGSTANSDVEAARDAGTRFSVCFMRDPENTGTIATIDEYSGTNPPTLTVSYTAGGGGNTSLRRRRSN